MKKEYFTKVIILDNNNSIRKELHYKDFSNKEFYKTKKAGYNKYFEICQSMYISCNSIVHNKNLNNDYLSRINYNIACIVLFMEKYENSTHSHVIMQKAYFRDNDNMLSTDKTKQLVKNLLWLYNGIIEDN